MLRASVHKAKINALLLQFSDFQKPEECINSFTQKVVKNIQVFHCHREQVPLPPPIPQYTP